MVAELLQLIAYKEMPPVVAVHDAFKYCEMEVREFGSKIQHDDIFYDGSGVHIIRLALSPILSDITLKPGCCP
jgi:hypothetical protein